VLIVSLLISAIIGVTLASYLIMMQTQHASVARSQVWNASISLTEAGVEDALALLNKYAGDYDRLTNWNRGESLAADNWSALSGNTYYVAATWAAVITMFTSRTSTTLRSSLRLATCPGVMPTTTPRHPWWRRPELA